MPTASPGSMPVLQLHQGAPLTSFLWDETIEEMKSFRLIQIVGKLTGAERRDIIAQNPCWLMIIEAYTTEYIGN